ncbi:NAD-dependent epimerase/dehydratase family protein [Butyrivibrio sp. FCS014]|uniref:NAD-dependent epimerase/dehydratase family protein n=1 Tax=Butyrivibrio sp. FCS014 TaxID=1408304 RepID=UPI0004652138|nr:NAD-dependent epimerase/dehydratase family protein [Butyrivibrio sp. FCS014]
MKVLILGGTGAIGISLKEYLIKAGHEVHITSRSKHVSGDTYFHQGNAHDKSFLSGLLNEGYDVIIDFMSYSTDEFSDRADYVLNSTSQYIFVSSARVYAPSDKIITEDCPRLLDVSEDCNYLQTDEYALAKARQEDVLLSSNKGNYTIVRPSLTYNINRLQYALGEKEEWLFRVLNNEKVVFPKCFENVYTTMSSGNDVARAISLLVGNEKSYGVTLNIAGAEAITWGEVNGIYRKTLQTVAGKELLIEYIDDWEKLAGRLGKYYQIKYARSISRRFDNSRLEKVIGKLEFESTENGISRCLEGFLRGDRSFGHISARTEAYYNRITGDSFIYGGFSTTEKIKYLVGRYTPYFEVSR